MKSCETICYEMNEDLICLGISGFNQLKSLATIMAALNVQSCLSVTTDYIAGSWATGKPNQ